MNPIKNLITVYVKKLYFWNEKWTLLQLLINEYDLISEYTGNIYQFDKRVLGKSSEYGGKKVAISKRVYSFNRDLRVHTTIPLVLKGS